MGYVYQLIAFLGWSSLAIHSFLAGCRPWSWRVIGMRSFRNGQWAYSEFRTAKLDASTSSKMADISSW